MGVAIGKHVPYPWTSGAEGCQPSSQEQIPASTPKLPSSVEPRERGSCHQRSELHRRSGDTDGEAHGKVTRIHNSHASRGEDLAETPTVPKSEITRRWAHSYALVRNCSEESIEDVTLLEVKEPDYAVVQQQPVAARSIDDDDRESLLSSIVFDSDMSAEDSEDDPGQSNPLSRHSSDVESSSRKWTATSSGSLKKTYSSSGCGLASDGDPTLSNGSERKTSEKRWTVTLPNLVMWDNLEWRRTQHVPNIEEDLFVYDDVVITKSTVRSKMWRVAGRKPTVPLRSSWVTAADEMALVISAVGELGEGVSRNSANATAERGKTTAFAFTDFNVLVDEVDAVNVGGLVLSRTEHGDAASASLTEALTGGSVATDVADLGVAGTTRGEVWTALTTPQNVARFATVTNLISHRNTAGGPALDEALSSVPKARKIRCMSTETVLGHASRVKCISIGPGEREFVSCSCEDACLSMHSTVSKAEIGIFSGHHDLIIASAFSPDGKLLATASRDNSLNIWDAATTKLIQSISHSKVVICCCFCPSSKFIVTGCQDKLCRILEARRGRTVTTFDHHEGIVTCTAYSPDGLAVCSASADRTVRLWSAASSTERHILVGHVGIVLACSFTGDGEHIVSNDEKLLCVWVAGTGVRILAMNVDAHVEWLRRGLADCPRKLAWTLSSSAPGQFWTYLIVACNNRFVYILDIFSGEEVSSYFCKAPVYSIGVGASSVYACGDSFGNVYITSLDG